MPERNNTPDGAEAWRPRHLPPVPTVWNRTDYLPPAAETARAPVAPGPGTAPLEAQAEKDAKVTLAGRVGKQPHVRRTRKGQLVAQFPLAVAGEDETTEEHTILAFGERATKVGKGVQKDDEVELIGYDHRRTTAGPGGTPQEVREVYAARIIRVADRQAIV